MLGIIINTYVTSQGLKQTLEQQKLETEALSSRRGRKKPRVWGRLRKKARDLGGRLVSKCTRSSSGKKLLGGEHEIKVQKSVILSSCF